MQKENKVLKGVNNMKRLLTIVFFVALSLVAMYGMADAIDGVCSDCHTMHDSQDGGTVAGSGPNSLLLKNSSCAGCHTGAGVAGAPLIDKVEASQLAGGTFLAAVADDDSKRHDVQDLSLTESAITAGNTPGNTGSVIILDPNDLTCAGSNGCHGKNNVAGSDAGIKGSHHATSATYRFLWIGLDGTTPVLGTGEPTYEGTSPGNSKHNVYSAHATQGISSFCNKCHDEFHGTAADETAPQTGTDGPWKRHPTDYKLFTGGAGWNAASTTLNYAYPIGLVDITGVATTDDYYQTGIIDQVNSAVICLSCHRAHASSQPDLLRFDYTNTGTQKAGEGGTTGCLSCHYLQR